jgi:phosphatidate phosphatase APP1
LAVRVTKSKCENIYNDEDFADHVANLDVLQSLIRNGVQMALNQLTHHKESSSQSGQESLRAFFVRDISNHRIHLRFNPSLSRTISTDGNGQFMLILTTDLFKSMKSDDHILTYMANDMNDKTVGNHAGQIYLMKASDHVGCSVISDIDDTIKISQVPNKIELLVNTFNKEFRAVPGSVAYVVIDIKLSLICIVTKLLSYLLFRYVRCLSFVAITTQLFDTLC